MSILAKLVFRNYGLETRGVWTYCVEKVVHIADRTILVMGNVNVLTNSVKISDQTNADFLQLNISQMDGKIG